MWKTLFTQTIEINNKAINSHVDSARLPNAKPLAALEINERQYRNLIYNLKDTTGSHVCL